MVINIKNFLALNGCLGTNEQDVKLFAKICSKQKRTLAINFLKGKPIWNKIMFIY